MVDRPLVQLKRLLECLLCDLIPFALNNALPTYEMKTGTIVAMMQLSISENALLHHNVNIVPFA
jgi:hypothetical protein